MSLGGRYSKNAGGVFSFNYLLVWRPKYRCSVLVKPVDARLKASGEAECEPLDVRIHEMEVMPDPVRPLVESARPVRSKMRVGTPSSLLTPGRMRRKGVGHCGSARGQPGKPLLSLCRRPWRIADTHAMRVVCGEPGGGQRK